LRCDDRLADPGQGIPGTKEKEEKILKKETALSIVYPDQFLGLKSPGPGKADAIIVPLPFEKTVSFGRGTWKAPRAILDASCEIEVFDEETCTDFEEFPRIHTAKPVLPHDEQTVKGYLTAVARQVSRWKEKFVLAIGGEHTITYGMISGLYQKPENLTVIQIDAHADLMDKLYGLSWSHGTVMRRILDLGCRILQIGVRSTSREEYNLSQIHDRIACFYAHEMDGRWEELLERLAGIQGDVYLTLDVDGLDPSVIPSTGTPQPEGLSWRQAMQIIQAVCSNPKPHLVGADVVEYIASPHPPSCDITAAKLVYKILSFWASGRK
jgi:agmatinase